MLGCNCATRLGIKADSGCSIHLSDCLDVPLPALPAPFATQILQKMQFHISNGKISNLFAAVNRSQVSGTIQWLTLSSVHLDE